MKEDNKNESDVGIEEFNLESDPASKPLNAKEVPDSIPEHFRKNSPFYALYFPNFRLFFFGQLISVAGSWMQTVAQNWVVWDLTHDPRWSGIVSGSGAILYVLFSVWGGQVADRYPRRTVLMWTQTVMMALAFALALLATNRWVKMEAWHIAVLSALLGGVNAFNMPAQQSMVSELIERRDALSNAIALSSLRFNLARFIGPVLAGVTLVKFGASACFAINGLSFVAVLISLSQLKLPTTQRQVKALSVWEGFAYIWTNRRTLRIVALIGTASLFAWSISTLFPMVADQFRSKAAGYSQLMMMNGIGAALGAFLLASLGDRVPRLLLVYGGALSMSLGLLSFAFAPSFLIALAILIPEGIVMIAFAMTCNTIVQESVPDELRGRVMAVYSLVFQGMMPLGGVEIGFLAKHYGAFPAIRFNAILFLLVSCVLLIWSIRDHIKSANAAVTTG